MSDLFAATKCWPTPDHRGLPFQVVKGRSWRGFSEKDIPDLLARLFMNSEAQAMRLRFERDQVGLYDVTVLALSCPPVPYSTLSGETLLPFIAFLDQSPFELWVHSEYWYWKAGLDDECLESLVDRFIDSQ